MPVIGVSRKQEIFEEIIYTIGSLRTRLHSLMVSLQAQPIVPGHIKDRIKNADDILLIISDVCLVAGKEWGEVKKMARIVPFGQEKIFSAIRKLEKDEDKIIKLVKELSAVVYSDRRTHDFLKTNHYDIYADLKRFMFSCIKAMAELISEERELEIQIEGLEKEFEYNAEATIAKYFPHIK